MDRGDSSKHQYVDEIESLRSTVSRLEQLLSSIHPDSSVSLSKEKQLLHCEHAPILIQVLNPDGSIEFANKMWRERFSYSQEDLQKLFFTSLLRKDQIKKWQAHLQDLVGTESVQRVRLILQSCTGEEIPVNADFNPVMKNGRLLYINATFHESRLRTAGYVEQDHFFMFSMDLLCIFDEQGLIERVNPSFETVLGFEAGTMNKKSILKLVHAMDRDRTKKAIGQLYKGEPINGLEVRCLCADGTFKWVSWTCYPVLEQGLYYASGRDISEKKHLEDELLNLSTTDDLTGLHNRRGFVKFSEALRSMAQREEKGFFVAMFDLDRLKIINDRFGHAEGDQAIREFANVLIRVFRESDIVSRLGGDEYAVSAMISSPKDAYLIQQRLYTYLEQVNQRSSRPYKLSCSMGFAMVDTKHELSLKSLLLQADEALYADKQQKNS